MSVSVAILECDLIHRITKAERGSYFLSCSGFLCVFCAAGGFMFKQWKERYLVLTMEGSLLVCRDADSPPDQVVALQTSCEAIAEGREILDLPRLPPGGRRDCCFAIILPQNKFLLLLTDNPEECK